MARALSIAVLVLFALALMLFTGALFSESALRAVVRYAQSHLPVTVSGVSGSLYSGVAIDGFVYDSEGVTVEGASVLLTPRWACALRSVICLEEIVAGSLIVVFEEDERTKNEQAGLPDFPEVRVDVLQIDTLRVRSGDRLERLQAVTGSDFALGSEGISIESLAFAHELARATVFGELRPDGRWSLVTEVEAARDMPEIAPGKLLPNRFRGEAAGDFTSVSATIQSLEGMELSSTVSLEIVDESAALTAVIDGLQSAGAHYLTSIGYELSGGLALELRQSGDRWFLTGEQSILDGQRQGDLKLRASELTGDLILEELRVTFEPESWASATGTLGRRDALAPKLKLQLESFPVPASVDIPADVLDGSLELALELEEAAHWDATDISLAIDGEPGPWSIVGDLSGSITELLPVGAVVVDGPPGSFAYEKASDLTQPAVFALREPVELGGVEVTEAVLRVVTAAQDELELTVDGELQTVLRLETRRSLDGVEFTLAPFELRFADETIRLEHQLAGSWSANTSNLALAPFCLQARASSLCSDELQLGPSGKAVFDLHFNEQLGDEIAGHSYALETAGTGSLLTSWSEEEWQGAELSLNFSDLRLDPFEENGAQGTIEFQKAALSASYEGGALKASLTAESDSAGKVDLDLGRSPRGLSGALRATDFNLRALDDLLPELGLETGVLSADMSLEGDYQDPRVSGQLSVTDLSANIPAALTRLDDGELSLLATGAGFSTDGHALFGGGALRLEGICCDRETMTAQLVGTRNRIELQEGLNAVVSSAIDLRIGREQVVIDGDLLVHSGTLEPVIPDEEGVALSRDIIRVDEVAEQDRRFDLAVALAARVEPGFTLRTKEVEATLSGDLRYVDSSAEPPALYGDLQVLGGELRAYGQTLRLSNGTVGFVGDPLNPTVRLAAEREIRGEDLRVGFRVTGRLEEPVLQLYSEPQRSERETLSYLLRGRGPDAGAALDATALALSLGATAVNQAGVLRSLDAIPGVSGVALGAEGWDDDMAATLSAYVGERLYLSYGVGIYEPVNALTARLYLQSRLWLEVVSRLENSIDLYYRFDRN